MSDSPVYHFVDTNVLVYAHDVTAGARHERARELVTSFWESGYGCLSTQVMQEFYVTVTRKVARPLPAEAAVQLIADLATWRVHIPEVSDVLAAIEIHRYTGIPYWDALVVQSALRLGCQSIWSEDLNPGQVYADVRVLNPFAVT